jgi:hypothetical protein
MGCKIVWQFWQHVGNHCLIRTLHNSKTLTDKGQPHDHHRIRRQALNPYFSKQSVTKLEPSIRGVVENLCRRLREFKGSKEPVNTGDAYAALTMDIISEYSFAKSYGCVDRSDFAPEWPKVIQAVSAQSALNKQFPSILKTFKMMPESLVEKLNPEMMLLINFQKVENTFCSHMRVRCLTDTFPGYASPSNSCC